MQYWNKETTRKFTS